MVAPVEARLDNRYSEMPISEVSRMGTAALRECVLLELEARGLWEDPEVQWAYDLSMRMHADEQRKDGPYIDHINRATLWVVREMEPGNPAECAKVVMLHDVIENQAERVRDELGPEATHSGSLQDQALAALRRSGWLSRPGTVSAIGALTYPSFKGCPAAVKRQSYARHSLDVTLAQPLAVVGKVGDRLDNANGNKYNPDPEMQRRLDLKYLPLHPAFVDAVRREDSLVPPERQEHIVAALEKGHQEAKDRLTRTLPGIPGLDEQEIQGLTLARLLG